MHPCNSSNIFDVHFSFEPRVEPFFNTNNTRDMTEHHDDFQVLKPP